MRKLVVFVWLFLMVQLCYAQKSSYSKLASEIKKNISYAAGYVYNEQPDYNIDSLCLATAKKSIKLLANTNWTNASYKNLGLRLSLSSKDKTDIKIFNFGYDCGGTRRVITHPIIQWKNGAGKTFAYNFSNKINCSFTEIYKLKSPGRNLYLLIGYESGDGSCYQSIVYVVEIKGDYLLLDQPVFVNRPYLNFCNLEFDFDVKTQVLRGLIEHASTRRNLKYVVEDQGVYSKSAKANMQLVDLVREGYYSELSEFRLKFNGQKFIKVER